MAKKWKSYAQIMAAKLNPKDLQTAMFEFVAETCDLSIVENNITGKANWVSNRTGRALTEGPIADQVYNNLFAKIKTQILPYGWSGGIQQTNIIPTMQWDNGVLNVLYQGDTELSEHEFKAATTTEDFDGSPFTTFEQVWAVSERKLNKVTVPKVTDLVQAFTGNPVKALDFIAQTIANMQTPYDYQWQKEKALIEIGSTLALINPGHTHIFDTWDSVGLATLSTESIIQAVYNFAKSLLTGTFLHTKLFKPDGLEIERGFKYSLGTIAPLRIAYHTKFKTAVDNLQAKTFNPDKMVPNIEWIEIDFALIEGVTQAEADAFKCVVIAPDPKKGYKYCQGFQLRGEVDIINVPQLRRLQQLFNHWGFSRIETAPSAWFGDYGNLTVPQQEFLSDPFEIKNQATGAIIMIRKPEVFQVVDETLATAPQMKTNVTNIEDTPVVLEADNVKATKHVISGNIDEDEVKDKEIAGLKAAIKKQAKDFKTDADEDAEHIKALEGESVLLKNALKAKNATGKPKA